MASACDRVISTPELLEIVFIQLDSLSALLFAQLVSRHFHTVIASSPKLQQKLFFRPVASSEDSQEWTINPLLRQHFVPFFLTLSTPDYASFKLMDWATSKPEAFLRADASWRKMLIVQPPPAELTVVRVCEGQGGDSEQRAIVPFHDRMYGGVTMGIIYDITESFLRENFESFGRSYLSFESSHSGPSVTLYLKYTQQCNPDLYVPPADIKSHGAETSHDLAYPLEVYKGYFEVIDIDIYWGTDLTVERGGMESKAWGEWVIERTPPAEDGRKKRPELYEVGWPYN